MIEQVSHCRPAAGSRRAKLAVTDVGDKPGQHPGGRRQVQHLVSPSEHRHL
jgi:hypothetical protein